MFEILYAAMKIQCEPLFKWFDKANPSRDPILVNLTVSPSVEPSDSATEGVTTKTTEADATMEDIVSAYMPPTPTPR